MTHKIMLANGSSAEITQEEAHKIASMVAPHHKEAKSPVMCNEKYLEKAKKHIADKFGLDEEKINENSLKDILYKNLYGFTKEDSDLLYEVIETAIGMHTKKILDAMDM